MVNSSAQVKTGAWDPEEDDLLYYWQSKVGNKWSEVAKHIPGRTGQQCAQRWRHKVNPNIRRDKWTPEEDAKLIDLVKTFGVGRWAEIARNCDGRTDQQCMGRWRRHLDPSIRRDSWSPEEDAKLRQLHAQYGTSWSRISKCLKGRTSQQCRARWHQINNGKGGSKPSPAPAAGTGAAASTAGKRGSAAGKRKTTRRRSDFTDSEDEEEPEDDMDDYEDEYEDRYEDETPRQQPYQAGYTSQHDLAAAAAAAAAEIAYSLEIPVPGTATVQQLHAGWNSAWAAAVSGPPPCDGVSYEAEEADGDSVDDDGDDDVDYSPSAAEPRSYGRYNSRRRYSTAASHSKPSIPPGASRFGPRLEHQREQGEWMPSSQKLLLSPDRRPRPGRPQQQTQADSAREMDEEETAGAETLLQMAHLLRRESCDFEPPSLRRSDFITASTPPKRTTQERPEPRSSDELSPSPFKRARSSSGALFRASAAAEQDSSVAPAQPAGKGAAPVAYRDQDEAVSEDEEQPFLSSGACAQPLQEQDEQDQVEADADSYMDPKVEAEANDVADDADMLALGLANGSYDQPLPDPARPSNASCLTVAGAAAAAFLSPPPVTRVPGSSSRWHGGMATPRQPAAQQNLMQLLGSPSFDRMPGYASPPSAGKTQPSAATLAALQSPQPSCVHEPFWTPFTGLVKDGVFTRGTTGTPDLPSAGKGRSSAGVNLSPSRRNASTGKKAITRRNLIASPAGRAAEAESSSQHTDESGKGAATAGCSGMAHGPSPACSQQQPVQQVNHRVVRRLDQHEAWGASSNPSPSKPPRAARAKDSSTGIGFSLFSPVKKQPVPLFNDSNINIGASPAKQSTDASLTITPLQHNLPSSSEQPSSPVCEPAACGSPSSALPLGGSPLGPKAAGRLPMSSSRRATAARSLLPPVHSKMLHKRLGQHLATHVQEQGVQALPAEAAGSEQQQEGSSEDASPMAISPAEVQGTEQQQQQQEEEVGGQPQLEAQGSGVLGRQASDPDTPVHSTQGPDNSSSSGTPNTPAGQQQQLGSLAAAEASPSNFVTPQQRQRPSRPLAPLHKDCLIAAATRCATGGTGEIAPSVAAAALVGAHSSRCAPAAAAGGAAPARADSASPGKAAAAEESSHSGSAPGSADSSKLVSSDRFMDSPLQVAAQQLQSPSQWHQGMVMLMRNLQQTPLQIKAQDGDRSGAGCEARVTGETGGVRAGSRALRRLQAELERGSTNAAAQQQQQQVEKDRITAPCDVQVPFSTAAAPVVSAATAPMLFPLFSHLRPADGHCSNSAVSVPMATPIANSRSSTVGSVSLVPAVINCSKAELLAMQGPGATAVAWPVQQRPDGGLMVSAASPVSDLAAPALLHLTPPVVPVSKSAGVVDKENSSVQQVQTVTGGAASVTYTPAAAGNNAVPGSSGGGRMTVVSIQPVTMVMGSSQQTGLSAVPPMYHPLQQPARSVAVASAVSMPERFINSHAVRSRLHALIDGV